mmetsp:Transcript_25091/g.63640  ORF Transcript_25091/g.63640 Transcript_25091/m.63640 type:complete len:251 (-) Transcript_25091:85-837(-)
MARTLATRIPALAPSPSPSGEGRVPRPSPGCHQRASCAARPPLSGLALASEWCSGPTGPPSLASSSPTTPPPSPPCPRATRLRLARVPMPRSRSRAAALAAHVATRAAPRRRAASTCALRECRARGSSGSATRPSLAQSPTARGPASTWSSTRRGSRRRSPPPFPLTRRWSQRSPPLAPRRTRPATTLPSTAPTLAPARPTAASPSRGAARRFWAPRSSSGRRRAPPCGGPPTRRSRAAFPRGGARTAST